jgi:hypothetical protein
VGVAFCASPSLRCLCCLLLKTICRFLDQWLAHRWSARIGFSAFSFLLFGGGREWSGFGFGKGVEDGWASVNP